MDGLTIGLFGADFLFVNGLLSDTIKIAKILESSEYICAPNIHQYIFTYGNVFLCQMYVIYQ